jgi:hypothetical protein
MEAHCELPQIVSTLGEPGGLPGSLNRRQEERNEHSNDRDYN